MKEGNKKERVQLIINKVKQRDINLQIKSKIDGKERIPDPEIVKKDGKDIIIRKKSPFTEMLNKLYEEDPIAEIPEDLSCSKRKIILEEICHEDNMGSLKDSIDDTMIGRDMSLKSKIINDRENHYERKRFKEKRDKLEEFFKSNVEMMMENRKIIMSIKKEKT
jgi:hypothetical protein